MSAAHTTRACRARSPLDRWIVGCVALAASVAALAGADTVAADEPIVDDVVTLRDGTRAQGILAEWSPTGDAVLVEAAGTRRIAASEIARVELAESRLEAERTVAESTVRVSLRGRGASRPYYYRRQVALHPLLGNSHTADYELSEWQFLCRAPCTIQLEPGREWLALSDAPTWSPMLARAPVTIADGRTITGTTRSAAGFRIAALIIVITTAVAGAIVALFPMFAGGDERDVLTYGALGLAGILVGASISVPFFLATDHAEVLSR